MKRYQQANDEITVSEELKKRTLDELQNPSNLSRPDTHRLNIHRWAVPAAALLAAFLAFGMVLPKLQKGADSPDSLLNVPGTSSPSITKSAENSKNELSPIPIPSENQAGKTDSSQNTPSNAVWQASNGLHTVYSVMEPDYPEMPPYPDEDSIFNTSNKKEQESWETYWDTYKAWQSAIMEQNKYVQEENYGAGLSKFTAATMQELLGGADGKNVTYSPTNLYLALSMLAETTGGNSRKQLLDLLGAESIEELRKAANDVWNANYRNDGATSCILSSSLWLNEAVHFVPETMRTLADSYHAASYQGKMGSLEFNKALQSWLNTQTGGLLSEQAENVSLDAETILALATTVYFRAKWGDEFFKSNTAKDIFHAETGDITCDFMHQGGSNMYYWSEQFSAVSKSFENAGKMWFILPDEGISIDTLLADENVLALVNADYQWENRKYLIVNLSVPKFDISSELDLCENLMALGITDVFHPAVSNFTPLTTDMDGIFISQATHAARVTIDEEGCTAAAFTVMAATRASMPPEETIDFVLDRPFLFVLTGLDGKPLFIGVVNQP